MAKASPRRDPRSPSRGASVRAPRRDGHRGATAEASRGEPPGAGAGRAPRGRRPETLRSLARHRAPGRGRGRRSSRSFLPAERASSTGSSSEVLRPVFGQGAWLLGVLLLVGGRAGRAGARGRQRLGRRRHRRRCSSSSAARASSTSLGPGRQHGRTSARAAVRIGHALSDTLTDLVSPPGAFVVLAGIVVAGICC